MTEPNQPAKRGFALLTPEQLRDVSASGGRTAHAIGKAHQFSKAEARDAGSKGGKATHAKRAADAAAEAQKKVER
jgi:uncharacterized protein